MSEEVNYKVKFANKYFDEGKYCEYDINNIDVILKNKYHKPILYIESKYKITDINAHRKALAQIVLTNKKQDRILDKLALIYLDSNNNDILELIHCDDSVMFNNDINWNAEIPSTPSKDAIDRINDRLAPKILTSIVNDKTIYKEIPRITIFKNNEIKEIYKSLMQGQSEIYITLENSNLVYNEWKKEIEFENIQDEQELINLFLVDILNGTKYKQDFVATENNLFTKKGDTLNDYEDLINEGTNLNLFKYSFNEKLEVEDIKYISKTKMITKKKYETEIYTIKSKKNYRNFWAKYKRPPDKKEFLKILEYSARFYSEKYRKTTGGEYTPSCFVSLQNKILKNSGYDMKDFLVFDPCAGVGNLENDFGRDYKDSCYLSTLEQMDVDTCKIKGFSNVIQFDYLANNKEPLFLHNNILKTITQICAASNKKLMVIMNPPYQNKKGSNTAMQFFNKVVKLQPQVIIFYYMTESFLCDEINEYIKSGYKIVSHSFSNAKTTFKLSEWSISQIIFDKDKGETINKNSFSASRYEVDSNDLEIANLHFVKTYTYDLKRPNLLNEIEKTILENQKGMILGDICYLKGVINLTNKPSKNKNPLTTQNLKYALLQKGINFNTHNKYFERNAYIFKGKIDDISDELFSDAICFSLFYLNMAFTNKEVLENGKKIKLRNYIMPFTHTQLGFGCSKGMLNVLEPQMLDSKNDGLCNTQENIKEKPFDFRIFLSEFEFSKEAKDLFNVALQIFRFYHSNDEYQHKDFNDSFYDITNAIMQKNPLDFQVLDSTKDSRITRVKTTKGSKGFGRNTIKGFVDKENLEIFYHFFDTRDNLARKINKQLLESNLLLWERENLY
ncbi:hypothetical protein [Helicobacter saguini]|uniref:hypothetical protein n=1 Tax=Helicobacter saguini TaxID=1548018 RepID=UPI0007E94494|nr:hypothetical protein [Helicobacter saguini]